MKNLLTFLVGFAIIFSSFAQSPNLFNYQGIARDISGKALQNQAVGLQITIRETTDNGNIVYRETHAPTTNQFGLFAVQVGTGTVVSGTMANINWGGDNHFMEVEMDETGGNNYVQMGVQQLISVPYAKHAETVENDAVDDADNDPANELQLLGLSNDTLFLSNGNFVVLPSLIDTDDQNLTLQNDSILIDDGTGVDMAGYLDNTDDQHLTFTNDTLYIEDGNFVILPDSTDADADPTNEYNISVTLVGTNLRTTDGGGTKITNLLPLVDDADADSTNEIQTLNISNDSLHIEDGNSVYMGDYLDNTDNQNLTLQNDSILISNGIGIDISSYANEGHWLASGNNLYNSNSGNVGVGTNIPAEKLSVEGGDVGLKNTSGLRVLLDGNTDTNDEWALFIDDEDLHIIEPDDASKKHLSILDGNNIELKPDGNTAFTASPNGNVIATGYNFGNRYAFSAYTKFGFTGLNSPNHLVDLDEVEDQGDVFNPTTDVFTAPRDGLYYFTTTISFDSGNGTDDTMEFGFQIDGTGAPQRRIYINPQYSTTIGNEMAYTNSTVISLTAGQTIGVMLSNVSGSTPVEILQRSFSGFYLGE